MEGVFFLLLLILSLLACLCCGGGRGGVGGAWGGGSCCCCCCGLLFVVLFAHVEGSDGGVLVVEPGWWGLAMSRVCVVGGGGGRGRGRGWEVDGEVLVVVVLAWVERVFPDCFFWWGQCVSVEFERAGGVFF